MAPLEIVRNFDFYDIDLDVDNSVIRYDTSVVPIRPKLHSLQINSDEFASTSVFDYPVIVDDYGVPWNHGNLYILNKLKGMLSIKPATLRSIANDLSNFLAWSGENNVDYLDNTGPRLKSPLYRFNRYLHDSIISGSLASSTAMRRMNAVIQFYSWLLHENIISQQTLWREHQLTIHYTNSSGTYMTKNIVSRDLIKNLRRAKSKDTADGYINDGGELRPLQRDELRAILDTVSIIGNTEMSLAFQFAVLTGARLGTVFTLRTNDFAKPISAFNHIPKIKIGGSSYINSKKDKEMVLLVPPKLYERFRVYLKSDRYAYRKSLSKHSFHEPGASEYVFLTRAGNAFYLFSGGENENIYASPKAGNAVQQFISNTLKSHLVKQGWDFPFKFHDLRATFGVNLLEWEIRTHKLKKWQIVESPDYLYILNYIRERLGHSSIKVTEGYLQYKTNRKMLKSLQSEFEEFLLDDLPI